MNALVSQARIVISRWDLVGSALIVVAILSGKLAATKLLGGMLPLWILEVRFWATAIAALCLIPSLKSVRWSDVDKPVVFSILALIAYLLVRSQFNPADLTGEKVIDLVYLIALGFLTLIVVSDNDRLLMAGAIIVASAGALFLIAAFRAATTTDPNFKWAAIGGPLTFYRLQFLGFCCAFWMFSRRHGNPILVVILMMAFLFGTLASLSKAAYFGVLIVSFGLAASLAWLRKWREMIAIVVVAPLIFFAWKGYAGSAFQGRTNQAYAVNNPDLIPAETIAAIEKRFPTRVASAEPEDNGEPRHDQQAAPTPDHGEQHVQEQAAAAPDKVEQLPREQTLQVLRLAPGFSYEVSFKWCSLDGSNSIKEMPTSASCHTNTVLDRTQRLLFAAKSLEHVTLFGHGIASFLNWSLNPGLGYQLEAYTYPHNILLEMLYEGGIVGLMLFLIALFFCLKALLTGLRSGPEVLALGGFGAFIFISSLMAGDFYDFRLFWLAALVWSHHPASPSQVAPSLSRP